jgi:hypothetical protein
MTTRYRVECKPLQLLICIKWRNHLMFLPADLPPTRCPQGTPDWFPLTGSPPSLTSIFWGRLIAAINWYVLTIHLGFYGFNADIDDVSRSNGSRYAFKLLSIVCYPDV